MFFSRMLVCAFLMLIFNSSLFGIDRDFETLYRGNNPTLFADLQQAVNESADGDVIVFNANVTIPFTEQLTLNKAVSFKAQNNSTVVFDGQHTTRLLNITGVPVDLNPPSGNGFQNIVIEGIKLTRANIVNTWEIFDENLNSSPSTFNPATNSWDNADFDTAFGVDSIYSENREGGAIYADGVNLKILNSSITDSYAVTSGAAVFMLNGNLEIENSEISGNMCTGNTRPANYTGPTSIIGGIICHGSIYSVSDFVIKNSKIKNNFFKTLGTMPVRGGIIYSKITGYDEPYIFSVSSNVISNNKMVNLGQNSAPVYGNLFYRSTEYSQPEASEVFNNNVVSGNLAINDSTSPYLNALIYYFRPNGAPSTFSVSNNSVSKNSGSNALFSSTGAAGNEIHYYNNTLVNNDAPAHSIFTGTNRIKLWGNIIGFNNNTADIKGSNLTSGGYNFIKNTVTPIHPTDLDNTLTFAELNLAEVYDEEHETHLYYVPLPNSPLIDASPVPASTPDDVDLSTDIIGNSIASSERDTGANEATQVFEITTGVNHVGGTVNPYDNTYVFPGQSKTVSVNTDTGYIIDNISVNFNPVPIINLTGMTFIIPPVFEDQQVLTSFEQVTNPVFMEVGMYDPYANQWFYNEGTISPVPDPQTGDPWVEVPYNESQTFRITADEFYLIDSIQIYDSSNGNITDIPITNLYQMDVTIPNIVNSMTINATFRDGRSPVFMEVGMYDPYANQWFYNEGTISPVPDPQTGDPWIEVPYNESQTFRITADEFYLIDSIQIYDSSNGNITDIPITNLYQMDVTIPNIVNSMTINATFRDGRSPVFMEVGMYDPYANQWFYNEGTISPVPDPQTGDPWIEVPYNESQTFRITADEFYLIDSIQIYDSSNGNITDVPITNLYQMDVTIPNIVNSKTINATFRDGRSPVFMDVGIYDPYTNQWMYNEGSISPIPDPQTGHSWVEVPYNESQTFRITSDEFYLIDSIQIQNFEDNSTTDIPVTNLYQMDVTIPNITNAMAIQATFRDGRSPVFMDVGIYDPNSNQWMYNEGSITPVPDPQSVHPWIEVPYNESQTFRITADEFYLIDSIQIQNFEDNSTTDIPVTNLYQMDVTIPNITNAMAIQATFRDGRSDVIAIVGEYIDGQLVNNQGTISPSAVTPIPYQGSHSFNVVPNTGFKIDRVTIHKFEDDSTIEVTISDPFLYSGTIENITDLVEITATFIEYRPSIYSIANGYTDPDTGDLMPAKGTISPESELLVQYGSDQTYTIIPDEGYKISSIVVDGIPQQINNVRYDTFTFSNVTEDHTISVSFTELPYEVNVTTVGNGTVTPESQKVDDGEDLEITITSNPGHLIDKISINGNISSVAGQPELYTLALNDITDNKEITVYFIEEPALESGLAYAGSSEWTTVNTRRNYDSMVLVTTPVMTVNDPTFCIRIQNVTSSSFDVRIFRLDGSSAELNQIPFTYFIADEGTYTEESHGIKMEAVKFNSTVTDRKGSWKGQARSYQNYYNSPVVIGQVMSSNDPAWSVFWSKGNKNNAIPNSQSLSVGKHVGEDPDNSRLDETVGYIVFEAGNYNYENSVLTAKVGNDTIDGVQNNGNKYTDLPEADFVVASQTAMDGGDGGFAVLLNDFAPVNGEITFAINEDTLKDSERKHTTEQVAWLASKQLNSTTALDDNSTITDLTASGNVILNDFLSDEVTIQLKSDVSDGTLLLESNGNFIYVSNSGLVDSFEYELLDVNGAVLSEGTVNLAP